MANTTNFGWETPDNTDLVKDGAAAMRTLGNSIDASFVDLKGGTTGQVLSKNSNTDLDFTWVAQDDSNAIQNSIVDAKGDLIVATAADTPGRLAVGSNDQVLIADSTTATGLKWTTLASGALTKISRQSFSNVASYSFDNVFSGTYSSYLIVFETISAATSTDDFQLQLRYAGPTTETAGYYGTTVWFDFDAGGPTSLAGGQLGTNNAGAFNISTATNTAGGTDPGSAGFMFYSQPSATCKPTWTGNFLSGTYLDAGFFGGGQYTTSRTYTGILFKSSSSNITGTIAIYGVSQ